MSAQADAGEDRYERWTPIPGVADGLHFKELRRTGDGLEIVVYEHASRRLLRVHFPHQSAFRSADEGDRLRTLGRVRMAGFLIVRNSSYVRWFRDETGCPALDPGLVHYAIFTSNDCIDVLSAVPPAVEYTREVEPPWAG